MSNLIIEPKHLNMLIDIFDSYCPDAEIWAYGSRVDGSAHSGSDLDLVVKNCSDSFRLYELKELLNASNIPFLLDIHVFNDLPESFQQEILSNYIVIYKN